MSCMTAKFLPALLAISLPLVSVCAEDILSQDRRALADALLARGQYRLALPEYQALANQSPPPEDAHLIFSRLAECQFRSGNPKDAIETCIFHNKNFASASSRFQVALTHAQSLEAVGDRKTASDAYDTISTDETADLPLRFTAAYLAGVCLFSENDFPAAKSRFSVALKFAQNAKLSEGQASFVSYAKIFLADIESRSATPAAIQSALKSLDEIAASASSPRICAEALFKAGIVAFSARQYPDAVARFSAFFEKYPSDVRAPEVSYPAALALFRIGHFSDALSFVSKTLSLPNLSPEIHADSLLIRAESLAALRKFPESISAFDELIASFPNSKQASNARFRRLESFFQNHDYQRVLQEASLYANPPAEIAPHILWLQAESASALKDSAQAAQFYHYSVTHFPNSPLAPDAAFRYASFLSNASSWLEASKSFLFIPEKFPASPLVPEAFLNAAKCQINLENYDDAVRSLDSLLSSHPKSSPAPEALFLKGVSLHRLQKYKDAGSVIDSLLSQYPSFPRLNEAFFERAQISFQLKDFSTAEKFLSKLLAAKPSIEMERESKYLLGIVLDAQNRSSEAAALLQPLLAAPMRTKLSPDRLSWLAGFQYDQKQYQNAIDAASALLERSIPPSSQQLANMIVARSHLALAHTNDAIIAFRLAASAPVKTQLNAEASLQLGEILLNFHQSLNEASQHLSTAAELASSPELAGLRGRACFSLAQCHELANRPEQALRLYSAVALLYEDSFFTPKALLNAARILDSLNRPNEAASMRSELQSRYPEACKE